MSLQDVRYWFEDLELRKKLEENQSLVSIGLVIVIVFCLSLIVCHLTGGGGGALPGQIELVYYDLSDQQIRVVEHEYTTPATSPLEGTSDVFLATVYACKECPKGKLKDGMTLEELKAEGMFIGWLEKIDPATSQNIEMFEQARSYRSLENDRWYKPTEKGYQQLTDKVYGRCDGVRVCLP